MYQVVYRYRSVAQFIEQQTGLRIGPFGTLTGVTYRTFLGNEFWTGLRRRHPFAAFVVVPPRHWIPRSGNPLEEEEPSPTLWF